MTEEKMALVELIEQASDVDLIREMLAFAAERMMEMEVEAKTGAPMGARTASRTAQRRHHVVPSGPSAVKSGGEYESWTNDSSRWCRPGGFGGDRAQ